MNNRTDRGRSVARKWMRISLSLVLCLAAAAAAFLLPQKTWAGERENGPDRTPLTAVPISSNYTPLVAMPVDPEEEAASEPCVNDYLGFTRTDLVAYLCIHANEYLGTPYGTSSYDNPTPGRTGSLQSDGFVWSAMVNVATQNQNDVPCGSEITEPYGNGGGWVNWAYNHHIEPLTFSSKEEMLSSGVLEKGDVIWSFDSSGPYGLSNRNHVGFFWGDDPSDDKFWQSSSASSPLIYAGQDLCNRITEIESLTTYPSVWWVFKLSDDPIWDSEDWACLPQENVGTYVSEPAEEPEEESIEDSADEAAEEEVFEEEEETFEDSFSFVSEEEEADAAEFDADAEEEEEDLNIVSSQDMDDVSGSSEGEDIVFYEG